jgi:hypothetical protein
MTISGRIMKGDMMVGTIIVKDIADQKYQALLY